MHALLSALLLLLPLGDVVVGGCRERAPEFADLEFIVVVGTQVHETWEGSGDPDVNYSDGWVGLDCWSPVATPHFGATEGVPVVRITPPAELARIEAASTRVRDHLVSTSTTLAALDLDGLGGDVRISVTGVEGEGHLQIAGRTRTCEVSDSDLMSDPSRILNSCVARGDLQNLAMHRWYRAWRAGS